MVFDSLTSRPLTIFIFSVYFAPVTMNSIRFYIIIVFLTFLLVNCIAEEDHFSDSVTCVTAENCDSCLRAANFCHWCDDLEYNLRTISSCNIKEILEKNGCKESNIIGNHKTFFFITEDKVLDNFTSTNSGNLVQSKPQRIQLDIKPGDTHVINFQYRLARNYPLEIYYLMDLTWSMKDDKETLVGLRNDLPIALKSLTDNFKLGFGSFADKPLIPYIAKDPKHLENPCSAESDSCEPTYIFRHRLDLTSQVEDFVSVINATGVTGNLDNAEATLEALMQVLVCEKEIGWSSLSRKIVLLATDGLIHFAGDGLLGGVIKKNDEKCHLDKFGNYTEESMDYPELIQIGRILEEKKIKVIFAVNKIFKDSYNKIHELLPETTNIGILESDSSNILNLVRQGYEELFNQIHFQHDDDDLLDIKYFSDCNSGVKEETNKCENVRVGETYNFSLNFTLKDCKAKHHGPRTITIRETQMGTTALVIDLNLYCKCQCKSDANINIKCPENAVQQCGKCVCHEGWMGPNCDCKIDNSDDSHRNLMKNCYPENEKVAACSGVGDCFCGTCFCDPGFSGKYCECRDCDKDLETGTVCGGPSQGICSCGRCICKIGYEGPKCSCPTGNERCILPGDSVPCSGKGICHCGSCECNRDDKNKYTGDFCEICANCDNPACALYKSCAQAFVLEGNSTTKCIYKKDITLDPEILESNISDDIVGQCAFELVENTANCSYPFTYRVQNESFVKILILSKTCKESTDYAAIAVPVFLSTLLLGLWVIIGWKSVIYIGDRRAYAKFEAESEIARLNAQQNPLYKSPVTTYRLPENYKAPE